MFLTSVAGIFLQKLVLPQSRTVPLSLWLLKMTSFYHSDIVKLTAQFVAKNGRTFLTNLINREQVR